MENVFERRRALVGVIACVALGVAAPAAPAGEPATARPQELRRADQQQRAGDGGQALARAATTNADAPAAADPAPRTRQPWTAIVAVAVAGAAAVTLLALLFRRNLAALGRYAARGGRTRPEEFFEAPSRPVEPSAESQPVAAREPEPVAAPEPEPAAAPEPEPEPVAASAASAAAPLEAPRLAPAASRARRGDHGAGGAAPPRATRPAAARNAPVCQVHWIARGSRFCAMTTDAEGVEHRLASSPRIESPGASPPEQTPEAQRALRQLAKELRERGWKPLRAKGTDFDEPQWYARRFKRLPEATPEGAEGGAPPVPATPG